MLLRIILSSSIFLACGLLIHMRHSALSRFDIIVASLKICSMAEAALSLPSWSANELETLWVLEDADDLLKRLSSGFREHEIDVNEHGDAEDAKDNVCAPLDVDKGRGDEVAQSEVERPVGGGSERDSLATDSEWIELGWVDPGDRAPSK